MATLRRVLLVAIFVAASVPHVACVSGPRFSSIASSTAAMESGKGRVYFYRRSTGGWGYGQRAKILVNGVAIGRSTPGAVFFVDLPAGEYEVRVPVQFQSGSPSSVSFALRPGESVYVRTWLDGSAYLGRTKVRVVDPVEGYGAVQDLKLVSPQP